MVRSFIVLICVLYGFSQQNHRAKMAIVIEDGDRTKMAKKSNRISVDNGFKIFVQPEEDSFIYVLLKNNKSITLLNEAKKSKAGVLQSYPSDKSEMWNFDGENKDEEIILIISPVEEYVLAGLLKKNASVDEVMKYITELEEKNKINLGNQQEKPFAIAGNVRAVEEINVDDMRIYSGMKLIVKSYEFKVKK